MGETPHDSLAQPINIRYDFKSVSDEKTVSKIVRFTETSLPALFNLALSDLMDDGAESDMNVTNNNSMRTVLATVIRIVDNFFTKFPGVAVTFRGSDERRTRLYRIVIDRELVSIQQRYQVFGEYSDGRLELFEPDADYKRFIIRLIP